MRLKIENRNKTESRFKEIFKKFLNVTSNVN